MGQALYRKYRSKTLDEVVGQDHITTTLKNAIKSGKISHAYLFTGPRGVGKTSVARILAHAVNQLSYTNDQQHLDIIEIDAASNRRIDEIRELRERVHTAPTSAKYKVYIIDEVHMLTKEAFNALLKTLEEPPAHVIFILATTEAQKLPETIVSRTQRFAFKPINNEAVVKHLRYIAQAEKIPVSDQALQLIARHGAGSFRDSISLLDQASNSTKKIDVGTIEQLLGIVPQEAIKQLLDATLQGEAAVVAGQLDTLLEHSTARQIASQLNHLLRSILLTKTTVASSVLTDLMKSLIDVPASPDPSTSLNIALVGAALMQTSDNTTTIEPVVSQPVKESVAKKTIEIVDLPEPQTESLEPSELWPRVLAEIKKHYTTLYSIARMAKTTIAGNELTLEFEFPFHAKRISEAKNTQIITDLLHKLGSGRQFTLICTIAGQEAKTKITNDSLRIKPVTSTITTISNIFGDAEVLES